MVEKKSHQAGPTEALKHRIREDIRAAMTAKAMTEVQVLRTLLAAVDNAEAVPGPRGHVPYVERPFGDPAVEVARKKLTSEDVNAVVEAECRERLTVAETLQAHGRTAEAAVLEAEAALLAQYRVEPT